MSDSDDSSSFILAGSTTSDSSSTFSYDTPTSSSHLPTPSSTTGFNSYPDDEIEHPDDDAVAADAEDEEEEDLDSLPSPSDTDSEETEGEESDAERQWTESLQQLELLLTMVLVPYLGKYMGRRCAYWGWAKWMEWMYPVKVQITNKASFRVAGAVEAAL